MLSLARKVIIQSTVLRNSVVVRPVVASTLRFQHQQQYQAHKAAPTATTIKQRKTLSRNAIEAQIHKYGLISKSQFVSYVNSLGDSWKPKEIGFALSLCTEFIQGNNDEVIKLFNDAWDKLSFVGYNIYHYNIMLNVFAHNKVPISLENFINLLNENKIKPDNFTFYYLLRGACLRGAMDEANSILQVMNKESIGEHRHSVSNLIMGYCLAGNYEEAKKIVAETKELTTEGWPDYCLFRGYALACNVDELVKFIKEQKNMSPFSLLSAIISVIKNSDEEAAKPLLQFVTQNHEGLSRKATSILQTMGAYETAFQYLKNSNHPIYKIEEYAKYVVENFFDDMEGLSSHLNILQRHAGLNFQYRFFNAFLMEEIKRKQFSNVHIVEILKNYTNYASDTFYPDSKCNEALEKLDDEVFADKFKKKYYVFRQFKGENSETIAFNHDSERFTRSTNYQKMSDYLEKLMMDLEVVGIQKYQDIAAIGYGRYVMPPESCAVLSSHYPKLWNDTKSLFVYLMLCLKGENYEHISELIQNKLEFVNMLNELNLAYILAERNLDTEMDIFLSKTVSEENIPFEKYTSLLKANRFDDAKSVLENSEIVLEDQLVMNFFATCPDFDAKKELIMSQPSKLPQNSLLNFMYTAATQNRIDLIEELAALVESEPNLFTDNIKKIMMNILLDNGRKCGFAQNYLNEEVIQLREYLSQEDTTVESVYDLICKMNRENFKYKVLPETLIINFLTKKCNEDLNTWAKKFKEIIPWYRFTTSAKGRISKNNFDTLYNQIKSTPMNELQEIAKRPLGLHFMEHALKFKDEDTKNKLVYMLLHRDSEFLIGGFERLFRACINTKIQLSSENIEEIIKQIGPKQSRQCLTKASENFLKQSSVSEANSGFEDITTLVKSFGMDFMSYDCYIAYALNCLNNCKVGEKEDFKELMTCYNRLVSNKAFLKNRGIYVQLIEQHIMKNGAAAKLFGNNETEV